MNANFAAHRLDQAERERQSQSGAFHARIGGRAALEWHEQSRQILRRNAGAAIAHTDLHAIVAVLSPTDFDFAALEIVFYRVGKQIDHHLRETLSIGANVNFATEIVIEVGRQAQFNRARVGQRAHQGARLRDGVAQFQWFEIEFDVPGLDARDVQHIVDKIEQMLAAFQNVAHAFALHRGQTLAVEDLAETQNRVERRAQFVADAPQKLGFGGVGGVGFALGLFERELIGAPRADVLKINRQTGFGRIRVNFDPDFPGRDVTFQRDLLVAAGGAAQFVGQNAVVCAGKTFPDLLAQQLRPRFLHQLQRLLVDIGEAPIGIEGDERVADAGQNAAQLLRRGRQTLFGALVVGDFVLQLRVGIAQLHGALDDALFQFVGGALAVGLVLFARGNIAQKRDENRRVALAVVARDGQFYRKFAAIGAQRRNLDALPQNAAFSGAQMARESRVVSGTQRRRHDNFGQFATDDLFARVAKHRLRRRIPLGDCALAVHHNNGGQRKPQQHIVVSLLRAQSLPVVLIALQTLLPALRRHSARRDGARTKVGSGAARGRKIGAQFELRHDLAT